jgi:N4-gp56 family major capsid protein
MTTSSAQTGLTPQQWDDQFFTSYVRANQFSRYMGTDEYSMIQVKQDLTKKNGDSVTYALVNDLVGAGVTGSTTLLGAEEALMSRSFKVSVDMLRHGVTVHEWDEQKSTIDLRNAAKAQLRSWAQKKLRADIINALMSINGVRYLTGNTGNGSTTGTTAAQKNAYAVDNVDRLLFGAAVANYSATWDTALGGIDSTTDVLKYDTVSLAKRLAKAASPAIRPIEIADGSEWFVMFCHSLCFRDLKSSLATIHQNAQPRGNENPLFRDGDIIWDGVICREIPEIPTEDATWAGVAGTGLGNGAIHVAPNFMCGAQALALAWAQRTTSRTDVTDYGAQSGVAIQEIRAVKKMLFGKQAATDVGDLVDHGVFTLYQAAVADA